MSAGVKPLEEFIYNGMLQLVGDPIFLGLLVFGFFLGFVLLQNTRYDSKLVILASASLLMLAFIPPLAVVFALVAAGIMYLGYLKFVSR